MTTKLPLASPANHKKLLARIAAAQKSADAAKKEAKLAKLDFRNAKQLFKDARRAAKKLRREVKALKAELAALAVKKKPRGKPGAPNPEAPKTAGPKTVEATPKPPAKRERLIVSPMTTATPFESPPPPADLTSDPVDLAPPAGPTS